MKKIIFLMATPLLMMACNNAKTGDASIKDAASTTVNKQERNKQVIMTSMENLKKGDIDAALKDGAAQFVDLGDGTMPPITSLDSLKSAIKMFFGSLAGYHPENQQYFTDGDYVLVKADWMGTFKKDLMGMKATGKPFKFRDIDIFKLNDEGKIVEHSSVQNIGAALMASGMPQ